MTLRLRVVLPCTVAVAFALAGATEAGIRPTWQIYKAIEHCELIVVGQAGGAGDVFTDLAVEEVIWGDASLKGTALRVQDLSSWVELASRASTEGDPWGRKETLDLSKKPLLVCLTRRPFLGSPDRFPEDGDQWKIAVGATGIKVLDRQNVYGFWQLMNPGPYYCVPESNSRDELLAAAGRGVELARIWNRIEATGDPYIADDARVKLLLRDDLPSHYCYWASAKMADKSRLVEVLKVHARRAAEPEVERKNWGHGRKSIGIRRWSTIGAALAYVDGGEELLPLLQRIAKERPRYRNAAICAAAEHCGVAAIEFLKPGLQDADTRFDVIRAFCRMGTDNALAIVEAEIEREALEQNPEHGGFLLMWNVYGERHADRFVELEERLLTKHPGHKGVAKALSTLRERYTQKGYLRQ
jgi:hypothetical protein